MAVSVLAPGEVHLWYTRLDADRDGLLEPAHLELLDTDERARHQRFHFAHSRHEFLVAHALVRTTLSRYAAVAPAHWRFAVGSHGRPEIAAPTPPQRLRFNLSHTRGLVACAIACEHDVGVDVEDASRPVEYLELAARFFSPSEAAALSVLPHTDHARRFFTYWTLKESYIKARGLGLSLPLDQFSFHLPPALDDDDPARISISFGPKIDDNPAAWHFTHQHLGSNHHLAVALRASMHPLRLVVRSVVPLGELLDPSRAS